MGCVSSERLVLVLSERVVLGGVAVRVSGGSCTTKRCSRRGRRVQARLRVLRVVERAGGLAVAHKEVA